MRKAFLISKFFGYMLVQRIKCAVVNKNEADYSEVAREWANYVLATAGINIETIGQENIPEGNCLFVGNHQSYIDIPIMLSQIHKPLGFIAKKELLRVPFISYWMKKLHCVFLDRDNPREAINSINEGVDNLKNYCSMVIFPSGTRSKNDSIGEFKKGSIKLGQKAGVPIVPVTIYQSYKGYEETGSFNSCNIKVIIDKPILWEDLSKEDKSNITEKLRNIISNNYSANHPSSL